MKEGQSAVNYITVKVVGANTESKLDNLQQKVGNAGKAVPVPALHFSIGHTVGTWSAVQASLLNKELGKHFRQSPPPTTTNHQPPPTSLYAIKSHTSTQISAHKVVTIHF